MVNIDEFVILFFTISLILNGFLGFRLYKKKHILSVDAKALLAEFMSGEALVQIKVIDPSGIFYRSPKG